MPTILTKHSRFSSQVRHSIQPLLALTAADIFVVIQGLADSTKNISHAELEKTIDFCAAGFDSVDQADRAAIIQKVASSTPDGTDAANASTSDDKVHTMAKLEEMKGSMSPEEKRAVDFIRARQVMRADDANNINTFTTDVIDGWTPNLERGKLTLLRAGPTKMDTASKENITPLPLVQATA